MSGADEILVDLYGAIEERLEDDTTLDGLSEVEADLLAAVGAKGIIDNGGLRYWYEVKRTADTHRVAEAFERLGLPHYATAMRSSIGLLPTDWDALDGDPRWAALDAVEEPFKPLAEVIWDFKNQDALDRASIRYALARRDDLIAAWKGYRKLLDRLAKQAPS
jgi:hypothetical protein